MAVDENGLRTHDNKGNYIPKGLRGKGNPTRDPSLLVVYGY